MPPPCFDQDFGLGEAVEDFPVEQFITQRSIERFIIAVLPWRSRCDIECGHADLSQPFLNSGSDKFAAIVRPYVCRRPTRDEQPRQRGKHIFMAEPTCNDQSETFAAGLVDDRQNAELPAIMCPPLNKIICPDMSRIFRPQSDV